MSDPLNCQGYDEARLDRLFAVYKPKLAAMVAANPAAFRWPASELEIVVSRMRNAMIRYGVSSVDILSSPAWRDTLKELGLKVTYIALRQWLKGLEATKGGKPQ